MIYLRTFLLLLLLSSSIGIAAPSVSKELLYVQRLIMHEKYEIALQRVNSFLQAYPQDVNAWFFKGVILAEQNRAEDAIFIFKEIIEIRPELPEPYNNLAVLYAERGQFDLAQKFFNQSLQTHSSYAVAYQNLGNLYAQLASEAYDKALKLNRDHDGVARTKLALLKNLTINNDREVPVLIEPAQPDPVQAEFEAPIVLTEEPLNIVESSVPPVSVPPVSVAPAEIESSEPPANLVPVTPPSIDNSLTLPASKIVKEEVKEENNAVQELESVVEKWAKAWSAKDVAAYLACYDENFKTPGGVPRETWEKTREVRINKPASIQVEVMNPKVEIKGNEATVTFRQRYRAGSTNMRTGKILRFSNASGNWLITEEMTQ